uniref:Uncharacterized protein n=1 Tax=Romanomermis culicivorax TaxID=13658 RepID=A0A915HR11_ROMCU
MKLAAKNLKNEHNLVIYNNTKGDNRVPGKNFDDDKCDYQKMKNNLNVSDQNDPKIYKIDDDSTSSSSPRFANNLYDNNSCDSINRTIESSCDKLSTIGQLTPLRTEDLRMTPFTNLYRQHHKHSTE